MESPLKIVERFEEITATWLTSALRQGGVLGNVTVESVDTEVIGLSAGYTSEIARLIPHYNDDEQNAPYSIIVKLPSLDPATQAVGTSLHLYERESRFYQDIGPLAGIRVPTCYYSAMDLRQARHVLLLEDFGPVGLGDQSPECTIEEARRALEALARMHAKWWESEQLDNYPWLASSTRGSLSSTFQRKFQQGWGAVTERFSGRLPQGVEEVGDLLVRRVEDVIRRSSTSPVTLVHGSFRPENLYFESGANVGGVGVANWQFVSRRQGALDVAYFIPYALPTDIRREHEASLLNTYLETLTDSGVTDYSMDRLVGHYRLGLLRSLVLFVIGDENLDLAVSTGEIWTTRRVASLEALADWNCAELLTEAT